MLKLMVSYDLGRSYEECETSPAKETLLATANTLLYVRWWIEDEQEKVVDACPVLRQMLAAMSKDKVVILTNDEFLHRAARKMQ